MRRGRRVFAQLVEVDGGAEISFRLVYTVDQIF